MHLSSVVRRSGLLALGIRMKRVPTVLLVLVWLPGVVDGQDEPVSQKTPPAASQSARTKGTSQEPRLVTPENLIPVSPDPIDGPTPCPAGVGKPCSLLGGRIYFSDPLRMTEHDPKWAVAMKNRGLIAGEILNLAATIADIEGTEACLHRHTCREGNPLFGSNPSRARAYGIGVPLNFALYSLAGCMKKSGQGNLAFALVWGGTAAHVYEASKGFSLASSAPPASPSSLKRINLAIAIRF